ncbi:helix-turn-helix protein [Stackebrandtia endophytica]|uniref:Helix-turn-helix protein n=2 Tax=Stackebrandtia endophytica TaxID=1496996 RepID=A0A543AUR6_9ACTN|nr:helix-turn-helix protein [Stackebrandtia endophytica]
MRAVWLGQALKKIREEAKLTTRQVGYHVGKDASTISRMESGDVSVPEAILSGIIEVCGVTDSHRISDLTIIRRDAAHGGWWDGYRRDVASTLMDRAWLESIATSIQSYETMVLPGLLQLPTYAEALMRNGATSASDAEIRRWVDMRMQRQIILSRYRPVKFTSIIDEQLLYRSIGRPDVMGDQLGFLLEIGQRPNVDIWVMPSTVCAGVTSSFEVFTLTEPYPQVGYVSTPAGDLCVEGETLDDLNREYDRLKEHSLAPERSQMLIKAAKDKM